MTQTYNVPEGAAAERLDVFVGHTLNISRSQAVHLLHDGAVAVNGRSEKASFLVRGGDTITITPPDQPAAPPPPAPDLPVMYEDADLLVVDKPAGLTVHPGASRRTDAPTATVADFARNRSTDHDAARPGIVHRLDRDTSGLLIIAKTASAKTTLQRQFRDRQVKKTYIALVVGHLKPDAAVIKLNVGRDPGRPLQQAVVPGGREAVTAYRTIQPFSGYSLIQAEPTTGRTHQIRVHLAAVGHPVAGDTTYGPPKRPLGLHRQFLHAAKLEFTSPSGRTVHLESPLPPDLAQVLSVLENQV